MNIEKRDAKRILDALIKDMRQRKVIKQSTFDNEETKAWTTIILQRGLDSLLCPYCGAPMSELAHPFGAWSCNYDDCPGKQGQEEPERCPECNFYLAACQCKKCAVWNCDALGTEPRKEMRTGKEIMVCDYHSKVENTKLGMILDIQGESDAG